MTTHRQHLECMETSLRVPIEVWSTSGNGCDDYDAVIQNKDSLNNSYPVEDSWAYDPDFETWDEGDLVDETTLDNSFASHQTDELGENHSYSGRSQPHTEAHSPTSIVSKSTVESRISYTSSHDSASQPDPQALQYEQLSSNSSTVMQSSRGDSWATVTPISCSSTPLKVNANCERHPRIDVKHSEVNPKRRGSHCTCEELSDPDNEVQNCSDQEFSKDDHYDSDEDSLDYRFNTNVCATAEASRGAKTEPRSKFSRTFDSSKVSSGDSNLDPAAKCHSDHAVNSGAAVQMDLSSTQVSSDQSSVITGLETGDGTDKQRETDADLMWMNSTEKMMENEIKHSTFDLALVLSQPPLSVLTPPFNPEDFENYTQVSQSMLKEKIIRLAALLQACRDLIAWNKEERQQLLAEKDVLRNENAEYARDLKQVKQEILNRVQEIKNREAEIESLKQALAEETREKVSNADEIKRLMDQMKKDNEKSEESLARFLGVAKQLKSELRGVRHELVRKDEEKRRELMQKEEEMRQELNQRVEEARQDAMHSEEEMRDEMVLQKEEEMRQELILKEEELREELREEITEEIREELREEIMQKEKETRFGMHQNDKETRYDTILKENRTKFELIHKEEAIRQEIAQRDKEIEALQMALEKEKQRHLVEEESVQQALNDYKRSVDQKLVEADHQINLKLEELIGQCQRYTKAAGKKGKHPRPASTKAVEQKTDPSVAEKTVRATTPLSVMSGRSSAVPASPTVTQSEELASHVNATTDNEAVPNQPRKSPMFSLAKTPTIKISLVSSEDSLGNAISPKVQQLLDIN